MADVTVTDLGQHVIRNCPQFCDLHMIASSNFHLVTALCDCTVSGSFHVDGQIMDEIAI